eukprot:NODE_202_length_14999_cov_0.270067.p2 type:complete len:579 gc:universal NODE_202_length_14999_cov_0.270067:9576-11312(+)
MLTICISIATAVSIDCPKVVSLATGLNMNSVNPEHMSTISVNCCNNTRVTCTIDRVIKIDWSSMGLTGFINGSYIPSYLQSLNLGNNAIEGTIPSTLPSSLTYLNLQNNLLVGSIPALPPSLTTLTLVSNMLNGTLTNFPSTLTNIRIGYNSLTGTIPALPTSLQTLYLFYNKFSGFIPNLPATLKDFRAGQNSLSGSIPTLPPSLSALLLPNNCLTGNLPLLPTKLNTIYLSSNQLTGSIPSLPSGLTDLRLQSNQFSGTIPANLPSMLQYLMLNSNLFTGSIPSLPLQLIWLSLYQNSISGAVPDNLPNTLTNLDLHDNRLSGNLANMPTSLTYLDVSINGFSGTLSIHKPGYLNIKSNNITDVFISDTSTLKFCDLSSNPLVQSSNINSLTMCTIIEERTSTTMKSMLSTLVRETKSSSEAASIASLSGIRSSITKTMANINAISSKHHEIHATSVLETSLDDLDTSSYTSEIDFDKYTLQNRSEITTLNILTGFKKSSVSSKSTSIISDLDGADAKSNTSQTKTLTYVLAGVGVFSLIAVIASVLLRKPQNEYPAERKRHRHRRRNSIRHIQTM